MWSGIRYGRFLAGIPDAQQPLLLRAMHIAGYCWSPQAVNARPRELIMFHRQNSCSA